MLLGLQSHGCIVEVVSLVLHLYLLEARFSSAISLVSFLVFFPTFAINIFPGCASFISINISAWGCFWIKPSFYKSFFWMVTIKPLLPSRYFFGFPTCDASIFCLFWGPDGRSETYSCPWWTNLKRSVVSWGYKPPHHFLSSKYNAQKDKYMMK